MRKATHKCEHGDAGLKWREQTGLKLTMCSENLGRGTVLEVAARHPHRKTIETNQQTCINSDRQYRQHRSCFI